MSESVTLSQITSADWSLMLDSSSSSTSPGSGIGSVVQGLDDIDQCIRIICTTIPGEDPFRPTFGVDLLDLIDKPIPVAAPAIVGRLTAAIKKWETRVTVKSISVAPVLTNLGQVIVTISWQVDLGVPNPVAARVLGAASTQGTTTLLISGSRTSASTGPQLPSSAGNQIATNTAPLDEFELDINVLA